MVKFMMHKAKLITVTTVLFLNAYLMTDQANAVTKTTVLPGFANLTYSDSIKLKSKGCQEINFSYVVDESLPLVNTAFIVQLVHKTKKIMYGYSYWFSDISTTDGLPSMSRIGTIPMKICRNNWEVKAKTETTKYIGVKPGSYELYFAFGFYDGINVGDKKVIIESIKLTS
jgi:hypothetical protein